MINDRNNRLKAEIIEQGFTLTEFARELRKSGIERMDLWTLSSIIHGRINVRDDEKRMICWKLQKTMGELFPEHRKVS